jgi:DNA-binding transcriptional LysR family regulator
MVRAVVVDEVWRVGAKSTARSPFISRRTSSCEVESPQSSRWSPRTQRSPAPIANGLVSPALAQLAAGGCEFRCSVSVETRFDIESKVASRSYNLGLISLPVENSIIQLKTVPILKARVGVIVPRDHHLAKRATVTASDLMHEPLIGLKPGQRWRDRADEYLGSTGALLKFWIETNATPLAISMVREGLGVSVIDPICAALLPKDDMAVFRPLEDEHWTTYASLHPQGVHMALAERFA